MIVYCGACLGGREDCGGKGLCGSEGEVLVLISFFVIVCLVSYCFIFIVTGLKNNFVDVVLYV